MRSRIQPWLGKLRHHLGEIKLAPVEKMIRIFFPAKDHQLLLSTYHVWKSSLHPKLKKQLLTILSENKNARSVFVFAPGLDWYRQLFQRPQQLAMALANQGALVFYTQLTPLEDNNRIQLISDRLFLCSIPLEQFSVLDNYFVYLLTWNCKYLLKFDHPNILYDYLDDITAFNGNRSQLYEDHLFLLQTSNLVTVTAHQLLEDAKQIRPDVLYVPNGVDFSHFDISIEQEVSDPPKEMRSLLGEGKPIVGYYGALANWFDYDLLWDVATNRKDLNFVIIGTDHDGSLEKSKILDQENIYYLGPKPYNDLPHFLACFDVAILPFKINRITQSTSPIKLFEYFAGGKPVVSTPLKEVIPFSVVLFGQDSHQFSHAIDEAILLGRDPDYVRRVKQKGQENTWNMRAEQILKAIENELF
jgi:glycosyltransferase involved in cell wall biosynthesis